MKPKQVWSGFWDVAGSVSIRTKIMGIVASLVLGFGLFVGWYIPRSETRYLTEQLEERGLTIARSVAAVGQDMALTNNQFGLYMLARNTLASNKDVLYVFITDSEGDPLVHTFEGGFPVDLLELSRSHRSENPRVLPLVTETRKIRDIAVPILGSRVGVVHVGLDESALFAYSTEHSRHILTFTLIALLLGGAFAYWLATILTRPILSLEQATRMVASNSDFPWQAPPWARDEIGRLGSSFNEMTRKVAERTREIIEKNKELTTLNALSQAISRPLDLGEKASSALKSISEGLELKAAWFFLLNPQSQKLELLCQEGVRIPITPGAAEELAGELEKGSPAILEKVGDGRLPLSGPLLVQEGLVPVALVALRSGRRFLGFLALSRAGKPFASSEVHLLRAIGEQLGVAVENFILWQELKHKENLRTQLLAKVISAQEEERKRIARELHDQTSQSITSLMVGLKVTEESGDVGVIKQRIGELRTLASDTLEKVRDLSIGLRPSVLDDLGLAPALNRYIKDYARKTGLSTQFQSVGLDGLRLRPEVETAIYRVVQEALTNVARHAAAKHVGVILERSRKKLRAITEDDGKGFDVGRIMSSPNLEMRLGLFGMEERISLIGGSLTIESAPGKGTTVYVEVPLEENRASDEQNQDTAG
ncbi:MAG: HAMP domain-containing protein [Chloroflexi bacterium]|nr:HAMP domain-containing protein [Chloroflexota bacterium]